MGAAEDIKDDVDKGIALLDEHSPGWDERINLEILSVQEPSRCILTQVYGDFLLGVEILKLHLRCYQYGFAIRNSYDEFLLNHTWKKKILERRLARVVWSEI